MVEEAVRERMDRMQSNTVDLLQVRYGPRTPSTPIAVIPLMGGVTNILLATQLTDASIDPLPP